MADKDPMISLKEAVTQKLIPFSYAYWRELGLKGLAPVYGLPGKGRQKNWAVRVLEIDEWCRNQTTVVGHVTTKIQQKEKKVDSRLSGRWT